MLEIGQWFVVPVQQHGVLVSVTGETTAVDEVLYSAYALIFIFEVVDTKASLRQAIAFHT